MSPRLSAGYLFANQWGNVLEFLATQSIGEVKQQSLSQKVYSEPLLPVLWNLNMLSWICYTSGIKTMLYARSSPLERVRRPLC